MPGCVTRLQEIRKTELMSSFTESVIINAPIEQVWTALADIGAIADWNPGLKASNATNDKIGLGATRHCVINDDYTLDEEVVAFDPTSRIVFRITRSSMPFKSADIQFDLEQSGGETHVRVTPTYQIKYGPLGNFVDLIAVRPAYRKGMQDLLQGLKASLEGSTEG